MPTAAYLLESQNLLANQLSRTFSNNSKWSLKSTIMRSIFREWDIPLVDLFLTKDKKCHQFCSWAGLSSGSRTRCLPSELGSWPNVCLFPLFLSSLRLSSNSGWTVPTWYLLHHPGQDSVGSLTFSVCLLDLPNLILSFLICWLSATPSCSSGVAQPAPHSMDGTWLDEEEGQCSEQFRTLCLIVENHLLGLFG